MGWPVQKPANAGNRQVLRLTPRLRPYGRAYDKAQSDQTASELARQDRANSRYFGGPREVFGRLGKVLGSYASGIRRACSVAALVRYSLAPIKRWTASGVVLVPLIGLASTVAAIPMPFQASASALAAGSNFSRYSGVSSIEMLDTFATPYV